MRWQEAAPGLERAKCVQRPMKHSLVGAHGDYVLAAHSEGSGARVFIGEAMESEIPGSIHYLIRFDYAETLPDHRIIAASRVERAVETQTFLDICDDEGLSAVRHRSLWGVANAEMLVLTKSSKSLRGAYLNYHKEMEVTQ